ncbi:unnamed protein product [Pleuronectes platessa]|uniref:Uncharacterized protein n=1 Tax=Pleuronectes platessa TaxID=8262 RepID=A0A9N7UF51_PLEPL|nr:unnamed protein product [Pleuronectes platessa]
MATLTLYDRLTGVEKCVSGLNSQAGARLRIAVHGHYMVCCCPPCFSTRAAFFTDDHQTQLASFTLQLLEREAQLLLVASVWVDWRKHQSRPRMSCASVSAEMALLVAVYTRGDLVCTGDWNWSATIMLVPAKGEHRFWDVLHLAGEDHLVAQGYQGPLSLPYPVYILRMDHGRFGGQSCLYVPLLA